MDASASWDGVGSGHEVAQGAGPSGSQPGWRRERSLLVRLVFLFALAALWSPAGWSMPESGNLLRIDQAREVWVGYGVRFGLLTIQTTAGTARAQYLRVDTRLDGVRVRPVLAGPTLNARATVGQLVRDHGALAGVNGSFFSATGRPLGLLILDGQLHSEPILERTSLFLTRDRFGEPRWWIGPARFQGLVRGGAHTRPLAGVNRQASPGELVVYTPLYGPEVSVGQGARAWAVLDGQVIQAVLGEPLPIPARGYVIVAGAEADAPWPLEPGIALEAVWGLAGDVLPGQVEWAVGGGPRLLREGQVQVTAEAERFQPDVAQGRAPRTAAGVDERGRLILLTVNGRQASSVGLTLTELAHVMAFLGAQDALNLDGGGSSTMVLRGDLFNRPSDGRERPVGNALLVFSDR